MRNLTEEIAVMDECLDREAAQNEDAEILASLTGLGTYTALLLAAEIGDISRFESPKNLVSWAGMCPRSLPVRQPAVYWKDKKD